MLCPGPLCLFFMYTSLTWEDFGLWDIDGGCHHMKDLISNLGEDHIISTVCCVVFCEIQLERAWCFLWFYRM